MIRYRPLRFFPNTRRSTMFTVGAFVESGQSVLFFRTTHPPGAECLGSPDAARMLLDQLDIANRSRFDSFERPNWFGLNFRVDPPHPLPEFAIDDPQSWLTKNIFSSRLRASESSRTVRPGHFRQGLAFLRLHGLNRVVREFRPERDFSAIFRDTKALDPPRQYVQGSQSGMFLEPLSINAGINRKTTNEVASRFRNIRDAVAQKRKGDGPDWTYTCAIYVLGHTDTPSTHENVVGWAEEVGVTRVYKVHEPAEATRFTREVRAVAAGAAGELGLDVDQPE